MGDLAFFTLIYKYLDHEINEVGLDLMGRMMTWASAIALVLVTLWILIQGYRIVNGQSREPMMALVTNMARIALIVTVATTMGVFGAGLHDFFTSGLNAEINQLVTGNDQTASDSIDQNLAYTQAALIAIETAAQAPPTDAHAAMAEARALSFATFGTASPPMAAAAMLLLYQFALALFIGLGPLFILCLIFEQTKELFRKWLLYGIGTLFSMAVLSLVSAIVLKMTLSVAEAMWASSLINDLMQNNSAGLTTQAMEQGGVGLLMTVLIVSVPPIAAMFFNGTLGSFVTYSMFNQAGNRMGPQGQPPGSWGRGYAYSPALAGHPPEVQLSGAAKGYATPHSGARGAIPNTASYTDTIKQRPEA
jgi:type IV secretion system protein VirB6